MEGATREDSNWSDQCYWNAFTAEWGMCFDGIANQEDLANAEEEKGTKEETVAGSAKKNLSLSWDEVRGLSRRQHLQSMCMTARMVLPTSTWTFSATSLGLCVAPSNKPRSYTEKSISI